MRKLFTFALVWAYLAGYAQPQEFRGFDLNTDPSPNHHSYPTEFIVANGKLFFAAENGAAGKELWISDGTTAGTQLLKDIQPGPLSSNPRRMVEMNGKIYFSADNGVSGHELWVSDGTSAGTTMVKDIAPASAQSNMNYPVVLNGKIYFSATDGAGNELWVSDGTSAGTQMVKDLAPAATSGNPGLLFVYNGKVYFNAKDGVAWYELWVTDGTSAGTQMVKDINPTPGQGGDPMGFTIYNNKLYFFASDGTNGRELWVTDGTSANTTMVKDINPGNLHSTPVGLKEMMVFDNKLYFLAEDGTAGRELWSSDGTASGTQMVKDINPGAGYGNPDDFVIYKGKMYFFANEGVNGEELWVTDGTSANTTLVKDINAGATGCSGSVTFVYKNFMYFKAVQSGSDMQLFASDGTAAGTKLVGPTIAPNANPLSTTLQFIMYDSTIFYLANYNSNGIELWAMEDTTTYPNSVKETKGAVAFEMMPNPAHDHISIKISRHFAEGRVQVTDMSGKIVQVQELKTGTQNIPLKGIAPGAYAVTVMLDDRRSTQRLVVE